MSNAQSLSPSVRGGLQRESQNGCKIGSIPLSPDTHRRHTQEDLWGFPGQGGEISAKMPLQKNKACNAEEASPGSTAPQRAETQGWRAGAQWEGGSLDRTEPSCSCQRISCFISQEQARSRKLIKVCSLCFQKGTWWPQTVVTDKTQPGSLGFDYLPSPLARGA